MTDNATWITVALVALGIIGQVVSHWINQKHFQDVKTDVQVVNAQNAVQETKIDEVGGSVNGKLDEIKRLTRELALKEGIAIGVAQEVERERERERERDITK